MRALAVLLIGAALTSCTTAPEPYRQDPRAQRELAELLAGKAAGRPVTCLPSWNANDMRTIDGRNVAFRQGRTVYLMQLSPGCDLLGSPGYAMLTKPFGGTGTCQGDIVQVIDTTARMTVGSCGVTRVIPYTTPGR